MIFVIIIAVAWIVILGPNLVRRRSRAGGGINSISHFHRQLRILEHSGPQPIVTPAFRLRSMDGTGAPGPVASGPAAPAPVLTVVGANQLPRPALAFLGQAPADPHADVDAHGDSLDVAPDAWGPTPGDIARDPGPLHRSAEPHARHLARRRRRDTLGVLTAIFVVTFLIGWIPGAGMAWALTALSGVALAGYVSMLVHLRRLADERERKLHYLRPGAERSGGIARPILMSGRYAHPSNQAAAAH